MFYPGGLIQVFGDLKKLFVKIISKLKERVYGIEE